MIELPLPTELFSRRANRPVAARIIHLPTEDAARKVDSVWWTSLGGKTRKNEIDGAWDWALTVQACQWDWYTDCYAIETLEDGEIQGAMAVYAAAWSILAPGQLALDVARLATAPQNRAWLPLSESAPLYQGVGSALPTHAILWSKDLRLEGRLILNVRKRDYAHGFYIRRGFVATNRVFDDRVLLELPAQP